MNSRPSGLRFERIVVPTPYRMGPANVYVFAADPVTLFDRGPNTPATETALMLGLERVGVRPEQVARVVISHDHPDHYGMAPRLRAISRYHRDSGTLFSGDTLLLHISSNPLIDPDPGDPTERRRSLIEYLDSLDRLSELWLSTVCPGHGEPIQDPHGVIEEMRAHHRRRTAALALLLDIEGKTGWQLAKELFPSLEGFDNFLAVSEVVAHVDLLIDQGTAERVDRGGLTYYRRPSAGS